jgi:peroxiredoxin family protein
LGREDKKEVDLKPEERVSTEKQGIGVIFHSGSYDRISHGLSIALVGLALGREVKLFFTYWALEYLKKRGLPLFRLDREGERYKEIIEKNIERGHLHKVSELVTQAKAMGAELYVCTNSMGILNIARNELVKEVDKSMGMTTFLEETRGYQMLFI